MAARVAGSSSAGRPSQAFAVLWGWEGTEQMGDEGRCKKRVAGGEGKDQKTNWHDETDDGREGDLVGCAIDIHPFGLSYKTQMELGRTREEEEGDVGSCRFVWSGNKEIAGFLSQLRLPLPNMSMRRPHDALEGVVVVLRPDGHIADIITSPTTVQSQTQELSHRQPEGKLPRHYSKDEAQRFDVMSSEERDNETYNMLRKYMATLP
eukprot:GHVS01076724.1.p1 GENE.GHVS01076724.1~~GHVS01076724.1.p1  ORF type:complete len:243 (+),score=43.56 GHVS01076724.1:110-730(+)